MFRYVIALNNDSELINKFDSQDVHRGIMWRGWSLVVIEENLLGENQCEH